MSLLDRLQASLDEPGFCSLLGCRANAWNTETQTLTLTMKAKPEFDGGAGPGHLHGGAIGAFVDTAATFAVLATGVERCPTVNYRVDLLRPVIDSGLRGEARVRRRGRMLAVVDVDVYDDADRLAAVGRATFAILD